MQIPLSLVLFVLYFATTSAKGVTSRDVKRVLTDYEQGKPPNEEGPTLVKIGMYINNMKLDYQHGVMDLSLYFRMEWHDDRLKSLFDNTDEDQTRIVTHIDSLWKPDLFVRNSDKVDRVNAFTDEQLFRVHEDGRVWHVIRLLNAMNCPMILTGRRIIQCSIMFESFGYTTDTITLDWLKTPVDVDPSLVTTSHIMKDIILYDCKQNYTAGTFPCLEARFQFERPESSSTFDKGIYVISILLVIISWLGFWIPPTDKRIFIGLGSAIILATLFMAIAEWREFSYVAKTTAAQGWITFCIVLVLGMVFEYAVIYILTGPIKSRVMNAFSGKLEDMEPKRSKCGEIMDVLFGLLIFPIIFIVGLISFGVTSIGFL